MRFLRHCEKAIIAKLPSSWNDFKKKLLHIIENLSLEQILKHLQIEEETQVQFKNQVYGKSNSKVHYVAEKSRKNVGKRGRTFREKPLRTRRQNKNVKKCHYCKQPSHFVRHCPVLKK